MPSLNDKDMPRKHPGPARALFAVFIACLAVLWFSLNHGYETWSPSVALASFIGATAAIVAEAVLIIRARA